MASPKLIVLSIVMTLVFLAIAVVGEGGFAAFFSHPALTVIAITTVLLAAAAGFTKGNISSGEREDRSNRWVIIAFVLLGVLSAFLPAYTDRIDFWTLDGDTVRWIGVVLFIAGGVLRL